METFDEKNANAALDRLNEQVAALSEDNPIHVAELIAVVELSIVEALRVLAGYTYEMQDKIMRILTGGVPEIGGTTAAQFAEAFEAGYMIDKQTRMVQLLEGARHGDDQGDDG